MLILTRSQNESIIIDGNIKITILSIKGQDVKIGIEAPEAQMVEVSKTIGNIVSLMVGFTVQQFLWSYLLYFNGLATKNICSWICIKR